MSKVAGKALHDLSESSGDQLSVYSMYDEPADIDEKYFPKENFSGFGIKRMRFAQQAILNGSKYDVVILSHLNLLPVGYLIKILWPKTTLILIAHGIEAWKTFKGIQKRMLFRL